MDAAKPALVIADLLGCAAMLKDEDGWEFARSGVQIRYLYRTSDTGPSAAFLRYKPGAETPFHHHLGYEHVLVLEGAQSDERGSYPAGTLVVNPPGSSHRVHSEGGCVVLIIWERGVRFPDTLPAASPSPQPLSPLGRGAF